MSRRGWKFGSPLVEVLLVALMASTFAGATQTASQADAEWRRNARLWQDPGPVERLDLETGPGGEKMLPRPPYTFLEEIGSGTAAKIKVRDGQGRLWAVKFGSEVKAEAFVNRLVWSLGYFATPTHFVLEGKIEGLKGVEHRDLRKDGRFQQARFQMWDDARVEGRNWTWTQNPFIGTREFNGLKILVMLVSNWDNKDARNVDSGSNNAIDSYRMPDGRTEYRYFISDWGGSLGKLGFPGVRNKWDCRNFTAQSEGFVRGLKDGEIKWSYTGTHNEVKDGISVDDVRWLLKYLGRLSDEHLLTALKASGADPEEQICFLAALRNRIAQLEQIASAAP